MRRLLIAVATVLATIATAHGQTPPAQAPTEPVPQARTVNLTVEQRYVIKEIVKDLTVPKVSGNVPATIGTVVPEGVPLQPMPAAIGEKVPQVKSHRFFVTNDRIVLVNPNDTRIAEVID